MSSEDDDRRRIIINGRYTGIEYQVTVEQISGETTDELAARVKRVLKKLDKMDVED